MAVEVSIPGSEAVEMAKSAASTGWVADNISRAPEKRRRKTSRLATHAVATPKAMPEVSALPMKHPSVTDRPACLMASDMRLEGDPRAKRVDMASAALLGWLRYSVRLPARLPGLPQ